MDGSGQQRTGRGSLDVLLKAQREWAQAVKDYHAAIVENAVARKDAEVHRGSLLATRDLMVAGNVFDADRK